ncbi:hypothetical protein AMECASPLE_037788 [Ameca splendens]|uniref:Uncharacterized protein n=1 Tax=Ameca splendens TaxID=208324 RepID=A0ABV0XX86_9TELE
MQGDMKSVGSLMMQEASSVPAVLHSVLTDCQVFRVEETQDLLLFFRTVRTFSERFDDRTRTFQHFQVSEATVKLKPAGSALWSCLLPMI